MTVKEVLRDDFELCLDYFPEGCKNPDWEQCETIIYSVSPEEAEELMDSIVDQLYANGLEELAEEMESLDGSREDVMSAEIQHCIGTSVLHVNYEEDIAFDCIED